MAVWETPSGTPTLGENEVHVWRIWLSSVDPDRAWASLSDAERRRAARHRFAIHRDRFVAARAGLRAVLARYLDVDPREVTLARGASGKPFLADDYELQFNLAHSEDMAVIAVARGRPVGVDVERMRRGVPHERLAARFFAPREAAALRHVPDPIRPAAFFACWTRKEAWLKASGFGLERGLPHALPRFAVPVDPASASLAVSVADSPQEGRGWSLIDLRVGAGYSGALAVRGRVHPRYFRWAS